MKKIKDSILYVCGELTSKAFPFLLLPYLTNRLGVDAYGNLTLALSIIAAFVIVVCVGQDAVLPKVFFSIGYRISSLFFFSGIILSLLISSVIAVLLFLIDRNDLILLLICAVSQVALGQCLILFQCKKESIKYVVWNIFLNLLSISLTVFFIEFFDRDYAFRIWAIVISNFAIIVAILSFSPQRINIITWSRFAMATSFTFAYGWPIIFQNISIYAKGQFDRLLLSNTFSSSELGVYSAGFQLSTIVTVLYMALNRALLPYFYEKLKKHEFNSSDVRRLYFCSLLLPVLMYYSVVIFPSELFEIVLGHGFHGVKYYVLIFSAAISINASYLIVSNYLLFFGKTKMLSACNVMSAVVHLFLLYFFARIDIELVPYALLCSNIFLSVTTYLCFERKNND